MDDNYKQKLILETAATYFYQRGISTVSMDDIAKGCFMSKKTIYQFFENKTHLIEEVLIYAVKGFNQQLEILKKDAENAISELFLFFNLLSDSYSKISFTFLSDLKKIPIDSDMKKNTILIEAFFTDNLKRGEKEGVYKTFDDPEGHVKLFSRITQILLAESSIAYPISNNDIKIIAKLFGVYLVSEKGNDFLS